MCSVGPIVLGAVLALGSAGWAKSPSDGCKSPVEFYGTYSLGTKAGKGKVTMPERVEELRSLGGNMIVGAPDDSKLPNAVPSDMWVVPGCSLMHPKAWKRNGGWDEGTARQNLALLADRFARHPRVYGICITHEVTEWADHARRVWMYKLAKEFFRDKPVIQYYATLWDKENARGEKRDEYGKNGERETDILFVSLQGVSRDGHYSPNKAKKLEEVLTAAARTPGVPVWGQTSINADHKYVTGPDSMLRIWGEHGEHMSDWTDKLFAVVRKGDDGKALRLSGFFWRSLGRFPYDLGYPEFADHRAQVRTVARKRCGLS